MYTDRLKKMVPSFLWVMLFPVLLECGSANAVDLSRAEYLGEFRFTQHLIQGRLYYNEAQNNLFIHRLYYDGEGPGPIQVIAVPKGQFNYDSGTPMEILQSPNKLSRLTFNGTVFNTNMTLKMPADMSIGDIGRVAIWCPEFGVSFGRVDLEETRRRKIDGTFKEPPHLIRVGPFVETAYAVSGTIFIQDARTLVIRDFNFNGQSPPAFFFAGEEPTLSTGQIIEYPKPRTQTILGPRKLAQIKKMDIVLDLPKNLHAHRLLWLSVWCLDREFSFGHVNFVPTE